MAFGGGLNETQEKAVGDVLKIKEQNYKTLKVEGSDVDHYLHITGAKTSGLFSSVYITRTVREGQNVVKVLTPKNIVLVTEAGYTTPLTTAGVSNLEIRVASLDSVGPVSGESALAGLYKALEDQGVTLNPDKVYTAQEELQTTASIIDNTGMKDKSYEDKAKMDTQLSAILTEIKTQLAEIKDKQVTDQQIEEIVNHAIKNARLEDKLNKEDIQRLVSLSKVYIQNKNSILDKESISRYKKLAHNITKDLQDKYGVQMEQAKGFLATAFESIKAFFGGLFGNHL
ncbi:DUF1002 domain-containing protein [Melissococcus plutonius]|uniref:DUF1002 domain-containing protein n=1 Tax=Melissococcus plutonius TaxID=33970 RepID=UPI00065DDD41|nr:DUF1002 domain-containing protein [Melissococcus plutonius]AIM25473.1 putative secreted protein [Melissococcus plutonius S1]KMT25745.1 putative secreted protein [Melissococcus plutonius]KMT27090.1 putative secreted protein [Melissococcus plutonius]KMT28191.1 putative secreted protein [Melissococcus plutonius]KMT29928.1 putative secreted protein [Melissococcus plutonius]